jgi:16S rRNA (guanine966-N2)-methyltransferase
MSVVMRRSPRNKSRSSDEAREVSARLRVIGGKLRGRTILYNGEPGLRPMKDRVRESLFNLLGPVTGMNVIDLFAGTGALSFEALSRGAQHAFAIERRFPNVRVIQETAASLGTTEQITVVAGDAFKWALHGLAAVPAPWLVFCCPPYDFYVARRQEMLALITVAWRSAPAASRLVVESDERFDPACLPDADVWKVRDYPPARLALARKGVVS